MQQIWQRAAPCARLAGGLCRAALVITLCLMITTVDGWVSPTQMAEAKTPGKTYCFKRKCHRVKTISETRRDIGRDQVVYASHYGDCRYDRYNPCGLTSSGERYRPNAPDNAASPVYPDGTRLLVWNPRNGQTLVLRINNAGPYWGNRLLDVSRAAARRLGFLHQGVARLHIRVLSAPTRAQARYRRHRRYAPVAGYIGKFASLDSAILRAGSRIAGLPPVPVSKVAMLRQPVLQLADAETRTVAAAPSRRLVALPARRPLAPLPVASLARSKTAAVRLAKATRRTPRVRRTPRQSVARQVAANKRTKTYNKSRGRKVAKLERRTARLPANLRAKSRAKRTRVRVAALRTSSSTKPRRETRATVSRRQANEKSRANKAKPRTTGAKPAPRVSIIGHLGWRDRIVEGQRQ